MTKPAAAFAALLLAACATPLPTSPSVLVLPGTGKSFDLFRADELDCRGSAHRQIGGNADQDYVSTYTLQRRFDVAFTQCMYAKGHRVPVSGNYSSAPPASPSPSAHVPPPPPGKPPAEAPADYRKN